MIWKESYHVIKEEHINLRIFDMCVLVKNARNKIHYFVKSAESNCIEIIQLLA